MATERADLTDHRPSSRWIGAASLLLTVLVAGALASMWFQGRGVTGPGRPRLLLSSLMAAVDADRPIEARLTAGYRHGPWIAATPAARGTFRHDADVRIAAARIHAAYPHGDVTSVEPMRDVDRARALGIAALILGDMDAAVLHLEDAAASKPDDGPLQSDLAAAYLARARIQEWSEDYPRAIAAAERATRIAPSLDEARFNLALALESIGLEESAAEAWRSYLTHDSSSAWANEARDRLRRMAQIARPPPQDPGLTRPALLAAVRAGEPIEERIRPRVDEAREVFDDLLLPAWGAAWLRGDGAETAALARDCVRLGSALTARTGDPMPREMCAALHILPARRTQTVALASGFVEYGRARTLYGEDKIADATKVFAVARGEFVKAGSAMADLCVLHEAIADYYAGKYDDVRAKLTSIVSGASARDHRRLEARSHWMLGLSALQQTDYNRVLRHYHRSLTLFTAAGDAINALAVEVLLAEVMMHLGDQHAEWSYRVDNLRRMRAFLAPRRQHSVLIGAANACLRQGLPEAAVYFGRTALALARRTGAVATELEAHLFMARAKTVGNPAAAALDHLRSAQQLLPRLPAGPLASRLATELTLAEAYVRRDTADAGIPSLDRAIAIFDGQQAWLRTSRLLRERALTALGKGDVAHAETDLLAAIERFTKAHLTLPKDQLLQLSHFEDGWPAFAELAELRARQHRVEEAAAIVTRGRLLLNSAGKRSVPVPETPRVTIPAGGVVLSYVVRSDRVLMWSTAGGGTTFAERLVGRRELRASIARLRRALQETDPAWTIHAKSLYELLIAPLATSLRSATSIRILPDDALASLPFQALVDPEDGRCLVERFEIGFAALVAKSSAVRPSLMADAGLGSPLVIDAGDAGRSINLPALPSSSRETAEVEHMLTAARTLRGADATRDAVLTASALHPRVIHFAGHAVANAERPLTSRLILAGGEPLFAYEMTEQQLAGTDVVFLAACTSLGGPVTGAGLVGLSSSMVAAGSRTVIGTLWDVDDEKAAAFARAFYRHYANGTMPSARAFREAVLEIRAGEGREKDMSWVLWAMVEGLELERGR